MKKLLVIGLGVGAFASAYAQTVSVNNFTTGYTQDFDSLTTVATNIPLTVGGGQFANGAGATLAGWYYGENGGTGSNYNLIADTGTSNTGRFYSYGTAAATDRSLGSASSGTVGTVSYGGRFVNNTGTSTGTAVIQFDLEQWRNGGNVNLQGLLVTYQLLKAGGPGFVQADFNTGANYASDHLTMQTSAVTDLTMSTISAQAFSNAILGPMSGATAGALDGNASANALKVRTVFQLFGAGQSWDPGDELVIRFSDINDSGNDHGFGIDNVRVVPEPASVAILGIGIVGLVVRRRRNNRA